MTPREKGLLMLVYFGIACGVGWGLIGLAVDSYRLIIAGLVILVSVGTYAYIESNRLKKVGR